MAAFSSNHLELVGYKPLLKDSDQVNHPEHYTQGSIECIEAIKASMTKDEFKGYLKGNAFKYLWRYRNKTNPKQDLQKASWYIERLINEVGEEKAEQDFNLDPESPCEDGADSKRS